MKLSALALVPLVFAAAPESPARRDGVELRWRGHVGDVLRLRMKMTQGIENSMLPQPIESESTFVFRQEVKQLAGDGVGSIELDYEAFRMSITGPVTMEYDSTLKGEDAKRNDEQLAALFRPMLDATIHVKIEPDGHVREIGGLKEVMDEAFETLDEDGGGMGQMFQQMFSEDAMRGMLEVNVFPEDELAVGDTWSRSMDLDAPMLGKLTTGTESELAGIEERGGTRCAHIKVTGEIELDTAGVESPFEAELTDSDVEGTMYVEVASGYLVEATMETSVEIELSDPSGSTKVTVATETEQHTVRIGEDDPFFE